MKIAAKIIFRVANPSKINKLHNIGGCDFAATVLNVSVLISVSTYLFTILKRKEVVNLCKGNDND